MDTDDEADHGCSYSLKEYEQIGHHLGRRSIGDGPRKESQIDDDGVDAVFTLAVLTTITAASWFHDEKLDVHPQ